METQKEGVAIEDVKVKTSKSYWIVIVFALAVYFIAFINLDFFSLPNAFGVLVGGFVASRLIEYVYSLITRDRNQIRRKLIWSSLFLAWAILYFFLS